MEEVITISTIVLELGTVDSFDITNYEVFLNHSTNGIIFIDFNGVIQEVNDIICEMLNYTRQELVGTSTLSDSSFDFIPIGSIDEEAVVVERKLVSKDGQFIDTEIRAQLLNDEVILFIIDDVTRQKKLERRLENANLLLDKRTKEMKCLNKISKYTWDSDTALELILFLIVETIPSGWMYPDDLVAKIEINEEEYLSKEQSEIAERLDADIIINNRKRGTVSVWYENEHQVQDIGPFLLEEDVLLTNVADRVGKLVERRENRKRLQIQEKKLMQTEKLEAVGKLAGGISHDFNNLLTAIIGFTELASLQLDNPDEMKRYLDHIQNSAERGSRLTRQLLAFSKHEFLNPELIKIGEIIDDLESILDQLLREDIEVIYDISDNSGTIEMDYTQIERIIINLVINARDAMPNGGKLTLASSRREVAQDEFDGLDAGMYVELKIIDTGIGMSEEVKDKIFDPFYTTKSQGTGLGLSTVYGIVIQHDGTIKVDSQPQEGTTITILLPAAGGHQIDDSDTADSHLSEEVQPKSILVIEDEPTIANIIGNALEVSQHKVKIFKEPLIAQEWATDHLDEIDLIISDMVMPQMNGIEFIDMLNIDNEGPELLFISGYSAEVLEEYGKPPSYAHFLRKPFSIKQLQQIVHGIFTHKSDGNDVLD